MQSWEVSQLFNGMALVIFLAFKMLGVGKRFPLFQIQRIFCNSVSENAPTIPIFINVHSLCCAEKLHYPCLATSVVLSNNVNDRALLTSPWLMHSLSRVFSLPAV